MTTPKASESWIPLESNPEVFNAWANKAGLDPSSGQFYDIYGLDPEFLSMIPRPVKAVILVFPYGEALARRTAEDERIAKEGRPDIADSVFWMKQSVGGACGTIALIHGLANNDVVLTPSSPLQRFLEESTPKTPLERGKLLGETSTLRDIHVSVCTQGQSTVPLAGIRVGQAYTCFVAMPRNDAAGETGLRVVELDGGRVCPVDWGECSDLLEDVAKIVREEFVGKSGSLKFSLMYLGQEA